MRAALRLAGAGDGPRVSAALRALSDAMGDTHRASDALIAATGFGAHPAFQAVLAETGAEAGAEVVGIAVFSPFLSTTRGKIGAFVTDLWVSDAMRGQGLGPRLLAAVRNVAAAQWGAGFLRLMVYDDNPRAVGFYERIGFRGNPHETWMTLEGQALEALKA